MGHCPVHLFVITISSKLLYIIKRADLASAGNNGDRHDRCGAFRSPPGQQPRRGLDQEVGVLK